MNNEHGMNSGTWTNTRDTAPNVGRALDPGKNGPNPGNTAPDYIIYM